MLLREKAVFWKKTEMHQLQLGTFLHVSTVALATKTFSVCVFFFPIHARPAYTLSYPLPVRCL